MTLTKKDITDLMHEEIGMKKNVSKLVLNRFLQIIKKAAKKNTTVKMAKFGTFKLKKTKKRMGRNPISKKEYIIESRKTLVFRPSSFLKNKMN